MPDAAINDPVTPAWMTTSDADILQSQYCATLGVVQELSEHHATLDPDVHFIRARHERESNLRRWQDKCRAVRMAPQDDELEQMQRFNEAGLICGGSRPRHTWRWYQSSQAKQCVHCGITFNERQSEEAA